MHEAESERRTTQAHCVDATLGEMRSAGSDAAALPGICKKVSELLSKCVCVRNAIHLKTPQSLQASGRVTAEVWRCCETASQQTGERKVPSDDHKTACFIRKVATVQR